MAMVLRSAIAMPARHTLRGLGGTPRALSSKVVPAWATVDPWSMSASTPAVGKNLVGGEWTEAATQHSIIDPLNGEAFMRWAHACERCLLAPRVAPPTRSPNGSPCPM